jgi:hypothetical protein
LTLVSRASADFAFVKIFRRDRNFIQTFRRPVIPSDRPGKTQNEILSSIFPSIRPFSAHPVPPTTP